MKFKEFIEFNNDRTRMRHVKPQVDDYHAFITDLHLNNIDSSTAFMPAEDLTPTQKNFNVDKVKTMMRDGWNAFPVTISNDDYVVDGHHRWAAALQLGETVRCHVLGMTFDECETFLRDKPYTSKRGINA